MNNGSVNLSNDGQNFNDYRYQKALKEISKLIAVNREIKQETEQFKVQNEQIRQKYNEMIEINTKMQQQIFHLRDELTHLKKISSELKAFSEKIQHEQQNTFEIRQQSEILLAKVNEEHRLEVLNIEAKSHHELNELMQEIGQKDHRIEEVENYLREKISAFEEESSTLKRKLSEAQKDANMATGINFTTHQNSANKQSGAHSSSSSTIKLQSQQTLMKKLAISTKCYQELNEELLNLKGKMLEDELRRQGETCQKRISESHEQTINPINQVTEIILKEYMRKFEKKISKLKDEKGRYEEKYKKMKSKCVEFQSKTSSCLEELNLMGVKLNGYEQLTQKQQAEIQRMIQDFNRVMKKVVSSSKSNPPREIMMATQTMGGNSPSSQKRRNRVENELKDVVGSLEQEISQMREQNVEKQKLLKYFTDKVRSLEDENAKIVQVNQSLQAQILNLKSLDLDLSKTSKIYNSVKEDPLQRTQPLTRVGNKVVMINGRKIDESQVLSQMQTSQVLPPNGPNGKFNNGVPSLNKNIVFNSGGVQFTTSQRNYSPKRIDRANKCERI